MASHTIKELKWQEDATKYPAKVEVAVRDGEGHEIATYFTPLSKLSEYVTTTALNTTLGNYVLTSTLTSELKKYLPLAGGTMTGTLVAPIIQTGTTTTNYFQSRKFRGEGDASSYYHAIDFGYSGHNQVDFYEYGAVFNFWKNENSTATSDAANRVASLQLGKLIERANTLTYPNKSGTFALTSDLTNFVTSSTLTSTLASYVTTSSLTTTLASYVTTSDLTTKLTDYQPKGNYLTSVPLATSSTIGGFKIGYTSSGKNYPIQLDSNGKGYVNVPWSDTTYSVATTSANGLMSTSDKSKLDNIESGANKYTLPNASTSTLGGVKVGNGLSISSDGTLSASGGVTIYSISLASGSYGTIIGGTKIMEGGTQEVIIEKPSDDITLYHNYIYSLPEDATTITSTNSTLVKVDTNLINNNYFALHITKPSNNVVVNPKISKIINRDSVKGAIISMNLGNTTTPAWGTAHQYRVLQYDESTHYAKVVAMYEPTTSQTFGSSQTYNGSSLDTYLNTTWYNTLSTTAKNAIVDQTIYQYKYTYNSSSLSDSHRSYADYSTKALFNSTSMSRHVYALDVEDIEMYFGGTGGSASAKTSGTYTLAQLMTLFYKSTTTISSKYFWLRSADAGGSNGCWYVYGNYGCVNSSLYSSSRAVRPAFTIDLSKIDYSIVE